ncbi:hypothetical protein [Dactylosporangium sp. CA-092794]|uniref:hypothetical protein n=1 Tax=Dactylosporangium sp. CA-092794 TaxID=3239929 RepID=UPI003D8D614B
MNRLWLAAVGAVLVLLGGCGGAGSGDSDVDLHISAKPVPSDPCALVGIDAFAQVMPNPEEIRRDESFAPVVPLDGVNVAVCRVDAGAGEARGSQLVMLVARYGDSGGKSGTAWAEDLTTKECADDRNKLGPTGGDLAADVLAGLGDQSCGVRDPGSSQRVIDYKLRVRRGRDEVSLDVTRVAGDADTPKHLAMLVRTVFDKLP